jgi:hypothetical protein
VKLSRPDTFNDPPDCRVRYRVRSDQPGRQRVLQWLTDRHRARFPEITEAARVRVAREFMSQPTKLEAAFGKLEQQSQRIAVAQLRLIRRIAWPHADIVEHGPGGAWPPPGYVFWQVERCPT